MAKVCRVLRSAKSPQAPRAAKVAPKKKKRGHAPAPGPLPASKRGKVHLRGQKQHARKTKHHHKKVCGGGVAPLPAHG